MKAPVRHRRLLALLIAVAAAGTTVSASSCKKDDDADEDSDDEDKPSKDKPDKEEPPPPATDQPAATAGSAPAATDGAEEGGGDVERYPGMVKQGGTVILLRSFDVYRAADVKSTRLTGLSKGTLVDLKHRYGNWMMIDWPSGPAQLSPGWVQLNVNDNRVQKVERPDAGLPPAVVPDAGVIVVPDAGVIVVPDAGSLQKQLPKFKLPKFKVRVPKG